MSWELLLIAIGGFSGFLLVWFLADLQERIEALERRIRELEQRWTG